jgi:predicted ABC-type ATPase
VATIFNLRGTNGSGKSALARHFLPPNLAGDLQGGPVDLSWYYAPTKRDPQRRLRAEGYGSTEWPGGLVTVGPYRSACGGMDALPSFQVCQWAVAYAASQLPCRTVIAEGVLASTVFGSWAEFARAITAAGHTFVWTYLQTPVEVCLERIAQRQREAGAERPIKKDQVRMKVNAIDATRTRAREAGFPVLDLPFGAEREALEHCVMTGTFTW